MKLVPVNSIPKAETVAIDNLNKLYSIFLDMQKICIKENGIGLSAVQIGIPLNLFIVKDISQNNVFNYYLNCNYKSLLQEKDIFVLEGCLSIRENNFLKYFRVPRYSTILVNGSQLKVNRDSLSIVNMDNVVLNDFLSIVFQHEIDHANGILISDIGKSINLVGESKC